ncbi:MAG: zeta toxin family protein [Alphaproteobacteria bacterium]|nr:zeta toxin family protein [Alphaproteobacteria bacterium]
MTSPAPRPTLFLIAGPNGAGKSTFYDTVLKPRVQAPFINADIIQRDELKNPSAKAAYEAARIASARRDECLRSGHSFVTETVFSHPSKLEMLGAARKAGFRIVIFHLHLGSADLAVARVAARVEEGGHPVPENKIRERYARNQQLIHAAILIADKGAVFDASSLNQAPRLLAKTSLGQADWVAQDLPEWFEHLYEELSDAASGL